MQPAPLCPRCGRAAVISGQFFPDRPEQFCRANLKWWARRSGPLLDSSATWPCCVSCGLIWFQVDSRELGSFPADPAPPTGPTAPTCPRCQAETTVAGQLAAEEGGVATQYRPHFLKTFATAPLPGIDPPRGCCRCGLIWAEVDAAAVRAFIHQAGTELARQQLDAIDHGPLRGLPNTTLARQIALKVAELDHLALEGKPNLVLRRYREQMSVTWDEAIAATRNWNQLTRNAKLELFGWVIKKPPIDELAEPLF